MAATTLGWNKHGQPHSVAAAAAAAATADVIGHIYFILYYHTQTLLSLVLPQKSLGFLTDTNCILLCSQINLYVDYNSKT